MVRKQTRAFGAVGMGMALCLAGQLAAEPGPAPLTGEERWQLYVRNTYTSPVPYLRTGVSALFSQLRDDPEPWEQGMSGFGKRAANRYARFALRESIQAGGAALLGHEVRYVRSDSTRVWPRVAHALGANFLTWDRDGRRVPHASRLGAIFATEFTATRWMPDGYRDSRTALRGVGMQLGISSAMNLVREFKPELRRLFHRK